MRSLPGDVLVPTWYEVSHDAANLADNRGTHYIDIWGYVEEAPDSEVSLDTVLASDLGAVAVGAECTSQCKDGLTRVGGETRRCSADGSWSGAAPRCLGTCCAPLHGTC